MIEDHKLASKVGHALHYKIVLATGQVKLFIIFLTLPVVRTHHSSMLLALGMD